MSAHRAVTTAVSRRDDQKRLRHRNRLTKAGCTAIAAAVGVGLLTGPGMGSASADPTAQDWANIRTCESGGNYAINTGNGYYGAYQFDLGTWRSVGGSGYPNEASSATQDALALALWRSRGWSPWACASLVSLSDGTAPPAAAAPKARAKPTPKYVQLSAVEATGYTNHLFRSVLGHTGGTAPKWTAALRAGAIPRAKVAAVVSTSGERRERMVRNVYAACLSRTPSQGELAARTNALAKGTVEALWESVCGSAEAFNRAGRHPAAWVNRVTKVALGRLGSVKERTTWIRTAQHFGLRAVVGNILITREWRTNQLNSIYRAMLGRSADAPAVRKLAPSMAKRGAFSAVTFVALSGEFARKS